MIKWFSERRDENRLVADLDALGVVMSSAAAQAKQWWPMDTLLGGSEITDSDFQDMDLEELRMQLNFLGLKAVMAKEKAMAAIDLDYLLRLEPFEKKVPRPVQALAQAVRAADEKRVMAEYDAQIAAIWEVRRSHGVQDT